MSPFIISFLIGELVFLSMFIFRKIKKGISWKKIILGFLNITLLWTFLIGSLRFIQSLIIIFLVCVLLSTFLINSPLGNQAVKEVIEKDKNTISPRKAKTVAIIGISLGLLGILDFVKMIFF